MPPPDTDTEVLPLLWVGRRHLRRSRAGHHRHPPTRVRRWARCRPPSAATSSRRSATQASRCPSHQKSPPVSSCPKPRTAETPAAAPSLVNRGHGPATLLPWCRTLSADSRVPYEALYYCHVAPHGFFAKFFCVVRERGGGTRGLEPTPVAPHPLGPIAVPSVVVLYVKRVKHVGWFGLRHGRGRCREAG